MESSEELLVEENSLESRSAVETPTTEDGLRRLNNGKKMREEESRRARHRTYRPHRSGSPRSRSRASRFLFQCLARSPEENFCGNLKCDSIPSWVSVTSSESVVTGICPSWKSAPSVVLFGWEPPLVKNLKRMWINRATAGAVSVPLHHAGCWDCSG